MNIIANGPEELEQYVEEHFVDPNGLIYSQLDSATGRPPTEETFRGNPGTEWGDWHVEGFSQSEFASYENYGMVTGAFMSAMILKYRLTGDPDALRKVRRALDGIRHAAEIGRKLEYGYLPKIYGDRFSPQTSTDQYLYILNALDEFRRLPEATAAERAEIGTLIAAAVEFWRKRDYRYTYFIYEDMKWPPLRFPSFLALAANVTGDRKYLEEAEAILRQHCSNMPENSRFRNRELSDEEKQTGKRYVWSLPDAVSMDTLNAALYLRSDPESGFAALWRGSMVVSALEGLRTVAPDGTAYTTMLCDLKTGRVRQSDKIGDKSSHGARTGWSTMILRGALLAARENPGLRQEMLKRGKEILGKFDRIEKFSYVAPEDAGRLPERYRFKCRFLSGDATSHALWCCYLMKELESYE